MREVNIMNTISISSYIKGAKNAKLTMDNCIKDGILFSAELIVLSILIKVSFCTCLHEFSNPNEI